MDEVIKAKIDITKGRSDEFELVARRLGKLIDALDLDVDTNNELVNLICKQVNVAERDALLRPLADAFRKQGIIRRGHGDNNQQRQDGVAQQNFPG